MSQFGHAQLPEYSTPRPVSDQAAAAASAAAAALSAEQAAASAASVAGQATAASNSASTAQSAATTAAQSATTSTQKAAAADSSAAAAAQSATAAAQTAETVAALISSATTAASAAANHASAAQQSANRALSSEQSASQSASTAATHAGTASAGASTATTKAAEAAASAASAATNATTAGNSAAAAAGSATSAGNSANAAANSAATASTAASAAETHAANAASAGATAGAAAAAPYAATAQTKAAEASVSAANASGSASAAASSASNAASSASTASSAATSAINALLTQYKGGVAGASVPATSTAAGDYYRITSAGSSQSKTWTTGDLAIYNGTSGSWTQIPAGFIDESRVLSGDAGRANRAHVVSDGATSNRRIEHTPGSPGDVKGMPIVIFGRIDVPTSNPSASSYFASFSASGTADPQTQANAFGGYISTTGALIIRQIGSPITDIRSFVYSAFRSTYSGRKNVAIAIVFPSGDTTTNPIPYIDGEDKSSSFTLTTGGTPPNWMPTTLDTTKFLSGYNWPAGRFEPFAYCLGSWTAAEVLEWTQTGRLPTWCELGTGSMATVIPSGRSVTNGASDANVQGLSDAFQATLSVESGARTSGAGSYFSRMTTSGGLFPSAKIGLYASNRNPGEWVYVRFWAKKNVGGTQTIVSAALFPLSGGTVASNTATFNITDSWQQFTAVLRSNAVWARLVLGRLASDGGAPTSGDYWDIDDVEFYQLGPIFKPVLQPCRIVDDLGSNGLPGVLASGMTPITERKDWRMRASVDTSSTGNKQLFGAAVFETPTAHAIDSIEADCTGTPTVNGIGDGTTAPRYAGSHALSAGRTRLTLSSTPFPADSAKTGIYANVTVTGGTAEKFIIRGHRID